MLLSKVRLVNYLAFILSCRVNLFESEALLDAVVSSFTLTLLLTPQIPEVFVKTMFLFLFSGRLSLFIVLATADGDDMPLFISWR